MEEKSYSQAMKELDAIVAKMQSEDCDIDRLAKYTTDALSLLKLCREKLFKTDEEIQKSLAELNNSPS